MTNFDGVRGRFRQASLDMEYALQDLISENRRLQSLAQHFEGEVLYRESTMPIDAIGFYKDGSGQFCCWVHLGPLRWEMASPGEVQQPPRPEICFSEAPDLLPGATGGFFSPIVSLPEPKTNRNQTGTAEQGDTAEECGAQGKQ